MTKFTNIYSADEVSSPGGKLRINKLFYNLIRFYFLFMPAYMLTVKIAGAQQATYWKDATYIICFVFGFFLLVKNKFILIYIVLIFSTLLLEVFRIKPYFEYITWLIMGLPLVLYFRYIRVKDYTFDCYIIGLILISAFIWTEFFEKSGKYAYTFADEGGVLATMRNNLMRVRYFFVSPMSFSQYCWFGLLVVFTNQHLNKYFKIICIVLSTYIIFTCNTRAGVLLFVLSVCMLIYTSLSRPKRWHLFFIFTSLVVVLFLQIFISLQKNKNMGEGDSDLMRITAISKGIQSSSEHVILGMGGEFFSTRSKHSLTFENSYLSYTNSFGIIGILFVILFLFILVFKTENKKIILFSIPWTAYSFVFPAFQEITAVIITWFIIGMILNGKRINELLYLGKDNRLEKDTTPDL